MAFERRFVRKGDKSFWHILLGRKQASLRLVDSRARYHLPYYRQHHTFIDALACAELLQAQCEHI